MSSHRTLITAAVAGSAFLLVALAPSTFDIIGTKPAFAKNDNDNGRGNGRGNDDAVGKASHDDGPGRSASAPGHNPSSDTGPVASSHASPFGGSSNNGPGQSASAPGHNKPSDTAPDVVAAAAPSNANGPKLPGLDADIASLHAAGANIHAFMNASDNSRIGRIRAYAEAAVMVEVAEDALSTAQDVFDAAANDFTNATNAYDEAVMVFVNDFGYATEPTADELMMRWDELLAIDPMLLTEAEAAEIAAIDAALAAATELDIAQTAYDGAGANLMQAQMTLDTAGMAASDALNAAANANRMPVSDEVRNWVDTQLEQGGVFDLFRGQHEEFIIVQ